jgi:plasmid stabilization system protein ParE
MGYQIRWTKRAASGFHKLIEFLQEKWGDRSAVKFLSRTQKFLDTIQENPNIGKIESEKTKLYSFVLSRHNTIFYRLRDNKIILVAFFDNRQDPRKRIK